MAVCIECGYSYMYLMRPGTPDQYWSPSYQYCPDCLDDNLDTLGKAQKESEEYQRWCEDRPHQRENFPEAAPRIPYSGRREQCFREWGEHLWGTGFAHGAVLVDKLGSSYNGRAGLADNVAIAEKMLEYFVALGWVLKGKYEPTREQRFFGIGGAPGNRMTSLVCHGFSPNWDHNDFRRWLFPRP